MAGLDFFKVESTETGGEKYAEIATSVLQDRNLLSIIEGLYLYIDPQYPLFAAAGIIRPPRTSIKVNDVGNVLIEDGKATISVGSETYLAPMLKMIWEKLGHDNVDQPDRFTVIITGIDENAKNLKDWIVIDPTESLFKDLIYTIQVIAPEGFKVRRENYGKNRFSYVASENTVPEKYATEVLERCFTKMEGELR